MFVYRGVKGTGIVLQGEICHNHDVKDDEIRIQITSIEQDVKHLEHGYGIELDGFAALPIDCFKNIKQLVYDLVSGATHQVKRMGQIIVGQAPC